MVKRACIATCVGWLLLLAGNALAAPREPVAKAAAPAPSAQAMNAPASAGGQAAGPAPRTITMRFHDVALHEVFDILSRQWRVNIVMSKGVTGRVTVNLFDVDITQAVRTVAQAAGYAVEMRGNDYVILDRQDLGRDVAASNTTLRTYKVQYSNVKQVAEILGKYISRQGKITMLPERNLLVVEDAPDFQERIERLLATIDVEPRQILIEAKILEITLDSSETYGVDWSRIFGSGSPSTIGTKGLAPRGSGLVFNIVNQNLDIFLSALSANGRVQTLSTPKLLALENQEAQAVIGERIGYKVTTTTNQVTTESIQFLETGVILKVTPSVDQRGRVLMSIHPEVSSASISAGIPSKKSTEVTTQLLCEDGQSVFIGGLIKRVKSNRRTGVPFLKDLPGVGVAFSGNEESGVSTETVVVITPRIIKSDQDRAALVDAALAPAAAPALTAPNPPVARAPAAAASAPAPAPLPSAVPAAVAPPPAPAAVSPAALPAAAPAPVLASTSVPLARPATAPEAPAPVRMTTPPPRRTASTEPIVSDDLDSEDERSWFTRMARQLRRAETP